MRFVKTCLFCKLTWQAGMTPLFFLAGKAKNVDTRKDGEAL